MYSGFYVYPQKDHRNILDLGCPKGRSGHACIDYAYTENHLYQNSEAPAHRSLLALISRACVCMYVRTAWIQKSWVARIYGTPHRTTPVIFLAKFSVPTSLGALFVLAGGGRILKKSDKSGRWCRVGPHQTRVFMKKFYLRFRKYH